MRLSAALFLGLLLPSAAAASTSSGAKVRDTCGARLATCASAQVEYVHMGEGNAPLLTVGGAGTKLSDGSVLGFRFRPMMSSLGSGLEGPQIIATASDDHSQRECEFLGRECPTDPAVTAPEPVTMTLLATGLLGMAGANRLRRRMNKTQA